MPLIILGTHKSELALDLKERISEAQPLGLKTPNETNIQTKQNQKSTSNHNECDQDLWWPNVFLTARVGTGTFIGAMSLHFQLD